MNNFSEIEMGIINKVTFFINETLKIWFNQGSRNGNKVNFLHEQIREVLIQFIDKDRYDIIIEWKVNWYLKPKDCDLVIVNKLNFQTENNKTIEDLHLEKKGNSLIISWVEEIISVKNPLSSYSKNKGNYYENVIGEAVNLKLAGVNYTQFLFISDEIPKYKKDDNWNEIFLWMDYIKEEEIEIFKKLKHLKVENSYILDDFVTFLYHVNRYDEDFVYKEELKLTDPNIKLYVENIDEIQYVFYFFEYLNKFISRYWKY